MRSAIDITGTTAEQFHEKLWQACMGRWIKLSGDQDKCITQVGEYALACFSNRKKRRRISRVYSMDFILEFEYKKLDLKSIRLVADDINAEEIAMKLMLYLS